MTQTANATIISNNTPIFPQTGLIDKNGRMIRNGDILLDEDYTMTTSSNKGCDDFPDQCIVMWDENEAGFKVTFYDPKLRGDRRSGYTLCRANAEKHFEIIGNVFENS